MVNFSTLYDLCVLIIIFYSLQRRTLRVAKVMLKEKVEKELYQERMSKVVSPRRRVGLRLR
jgi:hypothetical protein